VADNQATLTEEGVWQCIEEDANFLAWIPTMRPANDPVDPWTLAQVTRFKSRTGVAPSGNRPGETDAIPNVVDVANRLWLYMLIADTSNDRPMWWGANEIEIPVLIVGGLRGIYRSGATRLNRHDLSEFAFLVKQAIFGRRRTGQGYAIPGLIAISESHLLMEKADEATGALLIFELGVTVKVHKNV
jgi:hypothetical protein